MAEYALHVALYLVFGWIVGCVVFGPLVRAYRKDHE